ncbi:sodium-coupled monocarboxylate transporter 1-like [Amblyomma americanum]
MRVLEYVVFGVLVAGNFALGLYFSFWKPASGGGSGRTANDVFLGSRTLRILPLAASTVASLFSSPALVAMPAHFYAYGWHMFWGAIAPLLFFPLATHIFVPVLYKLGITSIFEYLRLRFNSTISLAACAIYIFVTQSVGAISIFAASVMLVTVLHVPLLWCNIAVGLAGTIYTALGGLRGVVWADCMQFVTILVAPATLIIKIIIDSSSPNSTIQPVNDLNVAQYIADYSFDLTSDENIWGCLFGSVAPGILRLGFDQVVTQRLMACRTLEEAKSTAVTSAFLALFTYFTPVAMGIALTVWFRGCDPLLSGDIISIDQILPYYINTYLVHMPGFAGLFLAGVVCAATSTTSSAINSQAAILYVDVIAPRWKNAEKHMLWITRGSALALGTAMTIYSTLCIYMGSLGKTFLMMYTCLTSPYVGLCLLAMLFPFVHSKGAGVATIVTVVYQLWHITHTIQKDTKPTRMPVSLDYCPTNRSHSAAAFRPNVTTLFEQSKSEEPFFLFRISSFWTSFFGLFATLAIGILVSAVTGEMKTEKERPGLYSDKLVRIWRKSRPSLDNTEHKSFHSTRTTCFNEGREHTIEEQNLLANKALIHT